MMGAPKGLPVPPPVPQDEPPPIPPPPPMRLVGFRCMKSPEGVIPLASYCDPCPCDVPVYEGDQ